jgi:hypothetical protein
LSHGDAERKFENRLHNPQVWCEIADVSPSSRQEALMNTESPIAHRKTTPAVLFVTVSLLPALVLAVPGKDKEPEPARSRAAAMVDAIINRNKPPKIVKWPGDFPSRAALFPEGYDWKEDLRARKAVVRLMKEETEEVWEEMVRRSRDEHYSGIATDNMCADAEIRTVGTICERLAYGRLIGAFWKHLPLSPRKEGQLVNLNLGINGLSAWRKQRAGKSLYELQIEVCDKAVLELAKENRIPQAEKDRATNEIKAVVATLKSSKKPVSERGGYNFGGSGVYNAEVAKRVRDGVKSGKYGDLGLAPK